MYINPNMVEEEEEEARDHLAYERLARNKSFARINPHLSSMQIALAEPLTLGQQRSKKEGRGAWAWTGGSVQQRERARADALHRSKARLEDARRRSVKFGAGAGGFY